MYNRLSFEVHQFSETIARLREAFPDADDDTLIDTAEGATDLTDLIVRILRSRQDDLDLVTGLKERLSDLQARLKRFEARADTKKTLVTETMETVGLKKIQDAEFTVSLRAVPPGLEIISEEEIPGDYWKPQPARLDRQSLLGDLKAGRSIPGACLGNGGMTLSVRGK